MRNHSCIVQEIPQKRQRDRLINFNRHDLSHILQKLRPTKQGSIYHVNEINILEELAIRIKEYIDMKRGDMTTNSLASAANKKMVKEEEINE